MRNGEWFPVRVIFFVLCLLLAFGSVAQGQMQPTSGILTITFSLAHIDFVSSNQFAVWIETEKGQYVKTIYATNFIAHLQGWKIAPQATPDWIKAASVKTAPVPVIDAISHATPQPGVITLSWDMRDAAGKTVAPGVYIYKIEGNLFLENMFLYTGSIQTGGARTTSQATIDYTPDGANVYGTMISNVTANYEPVR
jgi:hypothetical protein